MEEDLIRKNEIFDGKKKINREIKNIQLLNEGFGSQVKKHLNYLKDALLDQSLKENFLKEREKNFETIFNYAGVGIAQVSTRTGVFVKANKRFFEIVGWSPEELRKKTSREITYHEDRKKSDEYLRQLHDGLVKRAIIEKRYIRKDGSLRWVRITGSNVSKNGKAYAISVVEDIHEQKETEEKLKELAHAAKVLARALKVEEVLEEVSKFLVPKFADWLEIDFQEENGDFRRIKVAHSNPKDKKLAEKLIKYAPKRHCRECDSYKAMQTGRSVWRNRSVKGWATCPFASEELKKTLKQINHKTYIVVPLMSGDHALGFMLLRAKNMTKKYKTLEISFIEQIANLAAMAIEKARLFEKERKAVEMRDNFLSIASHELKTYLTSIKAISQLLERQCENSTNHDNYAEHQKGLAFFKRLDSTINRCTKLINNLMDVGRIESGRLILLKKPFPIFPLIKETVENFQQTIITHKIIIKGKTGRIINGDVDYISEVLTNLLSNAVKYSCNSDRVIVEVRDEGESVVVMVEDFGMGIAKPLLGKVFDRFFRAQTTERKGISGLGLGLYISSVILSMHHGKIWVESRVNKGTKFYFSIPSIKTSSSSSK